MTTIETKERILIDMCVCPPFLSLSPVFYDLLYMRVMEHLEHVDAFIILFASIEEKDIFHSKYFLPTLKPLLQNRKWIYVVYGENHDFIPTQIITTLYPFSKEYEKEKEILILCSNVEEIVSSLVLYQVKRSRMPTYPIRLAMDQYLYSCNYRVEEIAIRGFIVPLTFLLQTQGRVLCFSQVRNADFPMIEHGGWCFLQMANTKEELIEMEEHAKLLKKATGKDTLPFHVDLLPSYLQRT